MGLMALLGMAVASGAARLMLRPAARLWFIFIASLMGVFWLQPELPIRGLDFWLPVLTIVLSVGGWVWISEPTERWTRANGLAGGLVLALVLLVGMTRLISREGILTPSQPPPLVWVIPGALVSAAILAGLAWKVRFGPGLAWGGVGVLVVLLVVLKAPAITAWVSVLLRGWNGQSAAHASGLDVRWLGFSYLSFRLIHLLRDRQTGRRFGSNLRETLTYLLFFPAFTAGPIDRLDRFQKDLAAPETSAAEDFSEGGKRLALGLFKKFVLADSLALLALSSGNASQIHSAGWAWVALYGYALQIFLDFSGYTDLAIGLARLLGVRLPENFNAPYLRANLTLFWNHWHITLTTWFRGYYFNPLTRVLRRTRPQLAGWVVLLIMQTTTMVLIGLWHGISWNFLIWGLWHGLGLFVQNRYSDWAAPRLTGVTIGPGLRRGLGWAGVFLTFQYVALGWVWFVLPDPGTAIRFLARLVGG